MEKFDSRFNTKTTLVMIQGDPDGKVLRKVTEIHETRNWIKVEDLMGSFQRSDVIDFTNA